MQDLVNFMGNHRRSIYDTFGDKHALYMKALQRYKSTQNKKMRFLVEKQEPFKELVRQFLESSMRKEGEPQGCFIVNSGVELGVLDPDVASLVEDSYSKTEKLLYDLVQTGQQFPSQMRQLFLRNPIYIYALTIYHKIRYHQLKCQSVLTVINKYILPF